MALIYCPECKREVSDSNPTCIHCGFDLQNMSSVDFAASLRIKYDLTGDNHFESLEDAVEAGKRGMSYCDEFLQKYPDDIDTMKLKVKYSYFLLANASVNHIEAFNNIIEISQSINKVIVAIKTECGKDYELFQNEYLEYMRTIFSEFTERVIKPADETRTSLETTIKSATEAIEKRKKNRKDFNDISAKLDLMDRQLEAKYNAGAISTSDMRSLYADLTALREKYVNEFNKRDESLKIVEENTPTLVSGLNVLRSTVQFGFDTTVILFFQFSAGVLTNPLILEKPETPSWYWQELIEFADKLLLWNRSNVDEKDDDTYALLKKCYQEAIDRENAIKETRKKEYWANHPDEKKKLDSIVENCSVRISQLEHEISEKEMEIREIQKSMNTIPNCKEEDDIEKEISSLTEERSKLSLFQGKRKKEIAAQVMVLKNKKAAIWTEHVNQHKERTKAQNIKVSDELSNLRSELSEKQGELEKAQFELSKER